MSKSNYAIVGRIPYDEEDTIFCYDGVTEEEALERFEEDMISVSNRTREQLEAAYGEDNFLYVNCILVSDFPIKVKR